MEQANAAFLRTDWERALAGYQSSLRAFERFGLLQTLLSSDHRNARMGEVQVLYALGRYDEAMAILNRESERSEEFSQDPARLLWTGNLWFHKAMEEQNEAERRNLLRSAVDFYRKGLEVAPDSWDLRFNYELTSLVLSQEDPIRREQRERDEKRRLLPRIRTDQQRQRRVLPPEERG